MNVLITGCSSGFGKLAAQEFALEDHTVFATMREPKGKNAEAAKQLSSLKNVSVIEMDVTSDASVKQAVEECMARGGIDAVIHNAGIGTSGVAEANTVELFTRVLDVNLLGVHRLESLRAAAHARTTERITYVCVERIGPHSSSVYVFLLCEQVCA